MAQHEDSYPHEDGTTDEPGQTEVSRARHASRKRHAQESSGAGGRDVAEWQAEAARALRQAEDNEYQ